MEDLRPSISHEIRLSIHHPHPLVIEEAACSGLFGVESTAGMLILARDMRAHNYYLREATSLEPHMDRAWAHWLQRQVEGAQEEFFRLHRRYAQAARMVQLLEESIVAGCEEVLESLHLGVARVRDDVQADFRLAEQHGQSSREHGANAGGDCGNTGEGEQAGVEERRRR